MKCLHTLIGLHLAVALGAAPAFSQVKPADSTPPATINLSGRWRLSSPLGQRLVYATFRQRGTDLEAEITEHVQCLGKDVRLHIILAGVVQGTSVSLQTTTAELQGDFGNPCVEYGMFTGQSDFQGRISPNGKSIVGSFDHSGLPTHTWTFSR